MSDDKNTGFQYKTNCPSCPSSDAFAIYRQKDGRLSGYCFSCNHKVFNIEEKDNNKNNSEYMHTKKDVKWVLENTSVVQLPERGLELPSVSKYNIRASVSPENGEIDRHYYPYYKDGNIVAFKVRIVKTKDFYTIGNMDGVELFGQNTCGRSGKLLIITEGELDAVAASQLFLQRNKKYRVCSLAKGANCSTVKDQIEWLNTFDSIFLAFDQDKVGQEAAKRVASYLPPGKVKLMNFSEKDPNKMLQVGKGMEFFNSLYNAVPHRPDGIVTVDDIYEDAIKPVEHGLSWPWETLTKVTFGYRRREIYGIGGASGGGKTEYAKELINHIITVHKLPVGVIFLEEEASKTVKVLAGKKYNKRFHIPDGDWTLEELKEGINDLKGKVYLYNHFGGKNWESIKSKIRYMVVAFGIKDIFLDHLTALVAQEENEYKALNRIMEEMASLVQELDCTIFYISHLRKPSGLSHEEGGRVTADQFKGSGAIVYWSNFLFGIERNQQAEDEDTKNTTVFRVLKDRNTGIATGTTFKLWYDHPTGRWREKTEDDGIDGL